MNGMSDAAALVQEKDKFRGMTREAKEKEEQFEALHVEY